MNQFMKALAIAAITCLSAFGQSKEETMEFITREIKSFETRWYLIREVSFSPSGDTFTIRRGVVGRPERSLVIPLKNVDIYAQRIRHGNGTESWNLAVRCRGKDEPILVNNLSYNGTEHIIGRIENKSQAMALQRAFARLTTLATGRKELFASP